MLLRHAGAPIVVFAVWEPILPTDFSAPGTRVMARLSDARVRQYFDRDHLLSAEMKKSASRPECCERSGFLWDIATIYAPKARWDATLPAPIYIGGNIVDHTAELEAAITSSRATAVP